MRPLRTIDYFILLVQNYMAIGEKLTYLCCHNLYLFCLVHKSEPLHVAPIGFKVWSGFEKVKLLRILMNSESPTLHRSGRQNVNFPFGFPKSWVQDTVGSLKETSG